MEKIIRELTGYASDLRSSLMLECSREEAKAYGTLKEWKAADREIRRTERNVHRFQKKMRKETRSKANVKSDLRYYLLLCLPFLFLLLKAAFDIAVVALGVYVAANWLDKPFSIPLVLAVWLGIEVLSFFVRRRIKH